MLACQDLRQTPLADLGDLDLWWHLLVVLPRSVPFISAEPPPPPQHAESLRPAGSRGMGSRGMGVTW